MAGTLEAECEVLTESPGRWRQLSGGAGCEVREERWAEGPARERPVEAPCALLAVPAQLSRQGRSLLKPCPPTVPCALCMDLWGRAARRDE